ncbi:MAG: lipopolysaccharide biosynthesis protein [Vicinamibacterales bacterium]
MMSPPADPFATVTNSATLAGRSARGAAITLATQFIKLGITLLSTTILARLLTPRDYGVVGMAATLTTFVAIFKELGLSSATIQRQKLGVGEVSTLLWVNATLGLCLTGLTIALAPLVARFFADDRLTSVTASLALTFLLQGFTIQNDALLRRQMRFTALAITELASLMAGFGVAALLAWRGAGYWALVLSNVAMALVSLGGVWIACPWRPQRPRLSDEVREMLKFGGHLTGFSTINYFARNADNVLIGRVWGADQLGLYSRAYQLLMLPINQLTAPLSTVVLPLLSRLTDQPQLYRSTFLRLVEKLALVTMPGMMCLMLTADWLIHLLMGPRWVDAGPVFAWLGLAGLFQPVASATGWLFISQGRTRDMFHWGILGGSLTVVSIAIGVPWGALGVARSYAVGGLLLFPVLVRFVTKVGPVEQAGFYRTLLLPSVATIIVALLVLLLRMLVPTDAAFTGFGCALVATVSGTLLPLTLLPAGRTALQDTLSLIRLARTS